MKLKFLAAVLLCGTALAASAQQKTTPNNSKTQTSSGTTVLFSRSDTQTAPQTAAASPAPGTAPKATNAERSAVTFTSYNLDLHLAPRDHRLSARALLQIRNDGLQPLTLVPLQLSSSLNFDGASVGGQRLHFTQQTLNSDTDHTGLLHEADIQLPAPLEPQATLSLEVLYSGEITLDARRLLQLGTPTDAAEHSDWDRIAEDFTGLRGFGNVVWYPVASIPALLGDGDKVFAEIGRQKSRESDATVAIRLTLEYYLAPPSVIVLDGHPVPVPKPSVTPTQSYPGVLTVTLPPTILGFAAPSLFLANWVPSAGSGVQIYSRSEDQSNAQALMTAASMVQPLVAKWLGPKAKTPVTVIGLPESQDMTWEQGSLLLTAVANQPPESYTQTMSRALAHAYFQSTREWLDEGVATFLQTLWIEQSSTRTEALGMLESQRPALALAEPASPGAGPGEDLLHAHDPIYYRTKSTYVLWMLRDLAGEQQLQSALQAYDPAADTTPDYFQKLVEHSSGKDLQWFFDNWVYHDRGLPDLSITAFHASPAAYQGQYIAAVDIMNDGFAETEVPVTVRSHNATLTQRVLLPGKTRTVHRMLVEGQPDQVIVNDGTVPEVEADIHKWDITNQ
ncbi:MAG: M1 family aminopeptidase [Acidobacteriaceae bacterium]